MMALSEGQKSTLGFYKIVAGTPYGSLSGSVDVTAGDLVTIAFATIEDGTTINRQKPGIIDSQGLTWNTDDWKSATAVPNVAGGIYKAVAASTGTLTFTFSEAVAHDEFSIKFVAQAYHGGDGSTPWGTGQTGAFGATASPSLALGHATGIDGAVVVFLMADQGSSSANGSAVPTGWTELGADRNDNSAAGFLMGDKAIATSADVTCAPTFGTAPGGGVLVMSVVRPATSGGGGGGGGGGSGTTVEVELNAEALTGTTKVAIGGTTGWKGEVFDAPGGSDQLVGAKLGNFSDYTLPAAAAGKVVAQFPAAVSKSAGSSVRVAAANSTYNTGIVTGIVRGSSGGGGGGGGSTPKPTGFSSYAGALVFQDEFDGTSMDSSKWTRDLDWWSPSYQNNSGNDVVNYKLESSCLKMWLALNQDGNPFWRHWITRNKFSKRYGFFEAKMKLPTGMCVPAFWLFDNNGWAQEPEIDIIEAWPYEPAWKEWSDGSGHATRYGSTMHSSDSGGVNPYTRGPIKSQLGAYQLDAAFHTYGCKWDSNGANFYFDGAPMDVNGETISGQTLGSGRIDMAGSYFPNPMFILLQLAFKPDAVPSPSNTTFGESNSLWVDYVRVWDLA